MSESRETVLVTGAAGFIGSNFIRYLLESPPESNVVALDALTYSGSLYTIEDVLDHPRLSFVHGDIRDRDLVHEVFSMYRPSGVVHLAAESHVDRSIVDPLAFVETNVLGTVVLLQEATDSWKSSGGRFHHVSTDEVFGELGEEGTFDEKTRYTPRSPYSASKAASDHFVRAWGHSYGLDYVITNCTNNYGPYQFPEKLIPLAITRALAQEAVPVYGQGRNIRDWLHVLDHCRGLNLVYKWGRSQGTYGIGGESECRNIDLVKLILDVVDREVGNRPGTSQSLIEFVEDRPGHDFRYSMNIGLIRSELGWAPRMTLERGLEETVRWYLANLKWVELVESDEHRAFQNGWYIRRTLSADG